jgi:polysaccharide biosynthesis PFTS motif protein
MSSKDRAELRNAIRGYRILRSRNEIGNILEVNNSLATTVLDFKTFYFRSSDYLPRYKEFEKSVRQFLMANLTGINLNKALLQSVSDKGKPIVYPLPKQWRSIIQSHGFRVAGLKSSLLWNVYIGRWFIKGLLSYLKLLLISFGFSKINELSCDERAAYFDGLGVNNLPRELENKSDRTIINWYLSWSGRSRSVNTIHHNVKNEELRIIESVKIISRPGPHLPIRQFLHKMKFAISGAKWIFISIRSLMFGDWRISLMLSEIHKGNQIRFQNNSCLALDYLFNNSNPIYRPLWTIEAEKKGSRVLMYFYSTNNNLLGRANTSYEINYPWKLMSWTNYLVWDKYQEQFVRNAVGMAACIEVVGPIWFTASKPTNVAIPKKSIAVFDVQPHRESSYIKLGIDIEYYVPKTATKFIEDIINAASMNGDVIVFKRKRNIGKQLHPQYLRKILQLKNKVGFIEVSPEVDPYELIVRCRAVISMPYTSTALIARELDVPSVYYDPYSVLGKDQSAAHNIPVVSGFSELNEWIKSIS